MSEASTLLAQLLGQDTAREIFTRSLARNRVHHAYSFEGPAGVGKFFAALGLAQALVCETREASGTEACGTCSACVRAVLREGDKRPLHPDVAIVGRGLYDAGVIGRKSAETQEISVDQIRTVVLAHAAYGPHEGKARVFIIRGAEELGVSAANALLKMLEEPLPRTHFILVTDQVERLLPTLQSRTLTVRFGPLGDAVLVRLLEARGVPAAEAAELAALSEGSMARASALRDDAGQEAEREFVAATVAAAADTNAAPVLVLSDSVKGNRELLDRNLRALSRHFAKSARDAIASGADPSPWAARYVLAREALEKLTRNAAPPLVVEAMVFALRRT